MRCGLFGKLPAKRDFIAVDAPREFLGPWERWMQAALSASKVTLAETWQEAFLNAPIWRFWLGADLCGGVPVIGAFMPSVDGVGRYFPLTIFARPDSGGPIAPPELDAQDAWFAAGEDVLLSALDGETTFEGLAAAVQALAPPRQTGAESSGGSLRLGDHAALAQAADRGIGAAFATLREQSHLQAYAGSSFWWTIGGEGFPPLALAGKGMVDPYVFTGMLTGRFDAIHR